jgi:hypothetical protein
MVLESWMRLSIHGLNNSGPQKYGEQARISEKSSAKNSSTTSYLLVYSSYLLGFIRNKVHQSSMAVKNEHPERYGGWLNELDSPGVTPNKVNELNDIMEISSLTENLKQCYYQDYKGR